jgi:two-component system, NtrC family, sensor kinase
MTRRIEAEFQDQKRLSYLGLLSSGIAHEIKNPLNSIQMNLQLLEEEIQSGAPPAQATTWIDPIQKEIRRLERLVNDFLLFARPMNPVPRLTNVLSVIESLAALVAGEAKAKEVALRVEAPEDLPEVETDESLLRTALLNLVLNAIQSQQGPGTVTVRAFSEGGTVSLEVEDEGPGIPAEKREEVFQIFYTTKAGGSGLGLPIARRIVEGLGGRLSVVEKEGSGACFRADLPLEGAH